MLKHWSCSVDCKEASIDTIEHFVSLRKQRQGLSSLQVWVLCLAENSPVAAVPLCSLLIVWDSGKIHTALHSLQEEYA